MRRLWLKSPENPNQNSTKYHQQQQQQQEHSMSLTLIASGAQLHAANELENYIK